MELSGFASVLPRELSAERAILRRIAPRPGGPGELQDPQRPINRVELSTALFTVLGSRPLTNVALLEELVARGAEPTYGRLLAKAVAHRLGLPSSTFVSGGNYTERIAPTLRALRSLEVVVPAGSARPAPGRPQCFRLNPDHVDLVRGLLSAFRTGQGLPWIEAESHGRARFHLDRARRLNWEREFEAAHSELDAASRQIGRTRPPSVPEGTTWLLRGRADQERASVARSRGRYGYALRLLKRSRAAFRRAAAAAGAPPEARTSALGTQLALAELEATTGQIVPGTRHARESLEELLTLHRTGDPSWESVRQLATGRLVFGTASLLRGDYVRGERSALEADADLRRAARPRDGTLTSRVLANLLMNRSRCAVLKAVALRAQGAELAAGRAASEALRLAGESLRLVDGSNAVIQRRVGIAARLRLELLPERPSPAVRAHLIAVGAQAFRRSAELSPDEPDTLFEAARFWITAAGQLEEGRNPTEAAVARQRALTSARDARRTSTDHPALYLDDRLQSRARRPRDGPPDGPKLVRRLLPGS